MTGIKIDYTCVHTENYQGGAGEVVHETLYKKLPDDTMVQMVKGFALNNVLNQPVTNGYQRESYHIVKIELIEMLE